jgi:hypothetical protein
VVGSSKDRSHALIASTRAIDSRLDPKTEPRLRRIPDRPCWASSGTDSTGASHHRTGQTSFLAPLECELLDRHDCFNRL